MAKTIYATVRLIVDEDADLDEVISDYEFRHEDILDVEIQDAFEDELIAVDDNTRMPGYVGMGWGE